MRQAGRSLPEYRAIRERHAFFEVNRSAELTRRGDAPAGAAPRRRRGGDVRRHHDPGRRDGCRRRARRGRRPGRRGARPHGRRRSSACRFRIRTRPSRPMLEAIRHRPGRARPGAGGRRVLRRALHGRGLPGRGEAVARLRGHQGADVPRAEGVARGCSSARRHASPPTPSPRPVRAPTSVQLFDSWVGALSPVRLRRVRCARGRRACWRRCERPACPRSTSARALRPSCPAMAKAGGDVIGLDWRIPLDEGWALAGEDRARAGEPRPGSAARAVGAGRDGGARRARPRGRTAWAHLQPRPRRPAGTEPALLGRLGELVHSRTEAGSRISASGAPS